MGYYQEKYTPINNTNILKNYSFKELNNNGFDRVVYTPENTYDAVDVKSRKHDSRDELLAGTHLIVGAQLQIEEDNSYKAFDFYRDRSGLYYKSEKECFVALMHALNQTLKSQSVMKFTPYTWEGNDTGKGNEDLLAASSGEYVLYCNGIKMDDDYLETIMKMSDEEFANQIGSLAPAMVRSGDGKRFPWIENGKLEIKKSNETENGTLKIYHMGTNEIGSVVLGEYARTADENDVKSLLYEWLGAVDHFNEGRMYYAAGIDNPMNPTDAPGHYGVVRNNWYRLNLTDIKSMGIPVDDPDQPIVPERIGHNDLINVSVYLLPWHEEETVIESLTK